ncbi:PQQ-like beta-propeller repeat protein, partial [candidate division WOR-3 bacterium]|nr:PQQ-like beta-propeller repeat protein [candidate division WOR-3 bacterium]
DMALAIGTDASIYVGILDSLLAFDPSGNQRWALHLHFYEGTGFAVGSDGTIYGGAALTAIRPDGTILWSGDGWAVGAPVIGPDGTIYQETPHDLRAFKPDGTPLWTFRHFGAFMSTPAIAADGTIYVTSLEAPFLQAISPSGEELWRGLPWSEDFLDGPVAIGPDGTVYFAGEDGPLCAFAGTSPLANSPWPKYQHDLFNSGRAGGP